MRLLVSLIAFCLLSIRVGYAAPAFSPTNPLLEQNAALENKTPVVKARYYISLIIDDMGYRYQSGKRAINLPANITYSFLPYAPHARKLANFANKKQKENFSLPNKRFRQERL